MTFSYLIPCMNRTYNLRRVLPGVLEAAEVDGDVEVQILNYGSTDDLDEYVWSLRADHPCISYIKYQAEHYHMAHARNLGARWSRGDLLMAGSTDITFGRDLFVRTREVVEQDGYDYFMYAWKAWPGLVWIKRDEFVAAGGYDERFEFYGSEDRDFGERLLRRGLRGRVMFHLCPLLGHIPNDEVEKSVNYRGQPTKNWMARKMRDLYRQNVADGVLVANEGVKWGVW